MGNKEIGVEGGGLSKNNIAVVVIIGGGSRGGGRFGRISDGVSFAALVVAPEGIPRGFLGVSRAVLGLSHIPLTILGCRQTQVEKVRCHAEWPLPHC